MPLQELFPDPEKRKEEIGVRLRIPESEMNDLDQGTWERWGCVCRKVPRYRFAVKAGKADHSIAPVDEIA